MNGHSLFKDYTRIAQIDQEKLLNFINHAKANIPEINISKKLSFEAYKILKELQYILEEDELYPYYLNLLNGSIRNDKVRATHPSFLQILGSLGIDEITILKNIFENDYSFIKTYDFERGKGFYNMRWKQFDYPTNALKEPDDFDFYFYHLQDVLKLVRWPIYNTEAIVEEGVQTGSVEFSRMIVTIRGEKFISAIL